MDDDEDDAGAVGGGPGDDLPPGDELTDAMARALTDEQWDRLGDREMDLAAEMMVVIGPVRPPLPPEPTFGWREPARVYDRRLAVLTPSGVGEFLRACRASAGLSQRQVAEAAGVRQTTIARIEAGRAGDVRLSTLSRVAAACEVMLVGTTAGHVSGGEVPLLESDHAQRHRDAGDRLLPAHLVTFPRPPRYAQFMPRHDRPHTPWTFAREPLRDVPDD